ncbi:unnamed protein product [Auanema sp. JU1783]|nr:unnamed protein product [Auanema sp. JU1783]
MIVSLLIIKNAKVHFNLRLCMSSIIFQYLFSLCSRFIILLYQLEVFTSNGDIESNPVIICSSLIRTYYMAIILSGILILALERLIASHFIADYEIKERRHLAFLFVAGKSFASIICSILFTYEIIHWGCLASLGLACTFIGVYIFFKLDSNNQDKFAILQKNHRSAKTQYTLSLRFQLAENIKSTQIIKKAIVMTSFQNIVNFVLYVCANLDMVRESSVTLSQCIETAFNCSIAMYGLVIAVAAIVRHPYFAQVLREAEWAAFLFRDKRPVNTVDNETNVYFTTLNSQWNLQLANTNQGKNLLILSCERFIATIFIKDYEKKERKYIGLILLFLLTCFALTDAFAFVYELAHWILMAVLGFLSSLTGVVVTFNRWQSQTAANSFQTLEYIHRKNDSRWNKINSIHDQRSSYSLSYRFQLNENVSSLKIIRPSIIALFVTDVISVPLYILAHYNFKRDNAREPSQIFVFLFNISVTISSLAVPGVICFNSKDLMARLKNNKFLGSLLKWYTPAVNGGNVNETAVHFTSLQSMWDPTIKYSFSAL